VVRVSSQDTEPAREREDHRAFCTGQSEQKRRGSLRGALAGFIQAAGLAAAFRRR